MGLGFCTLKESRCGMWISARLKSWDKVSCLMTSCLTNARVCVAYDDDRKNCQDDQGSSTSTRS